MQLQGERSSFFCLTIGYNKIIMIWLASYSDQRIGFITREKGLKWRRGEDGGSEFRDLRPPEGDRMQLPGVSSRCWRPWSMSSGLFALNMWRRCNSWGNPVFVVDRAWDLVTLLWHIITQSKWADSSWVNTCWSKKTIPSLSNNISHMIRWILLVCYVVAF